MDKSGPERDGLQYLCQEDPEFAIFYREFLTNQSRPSTEHRIAICGMRGAGHRALADILPTAVAGDPSAVLADRQEKPTREPDTRRYIFTQDLNDSHSGALAGAIGADWILFVHSRGEGALAPVEIRFLTALRHRFPDLGRRMMVITDGDKHRDKTHEAAGIALEKSLASLFPPPYRIISLSPDGDATDNNGKNALRDKIRRQLDELRASYPGGLAALRANAAAFLLDSLDYFIATAITRREQRLTEIDRDLEQTCALWRQDLLILDDLLRQRLTQRHLT
ncbi:hypothetical protein [Acerihabitans sp.]|uniref:hypothetical protein n=1 Tax=Acerihabitans sp. TaxID=2811394 RepID=UPI002ED88A95